MGLFCAVYDQTGLNNNFLVISLKLLVKGFTQECTLFSALLIEMCETDFLDYYVEIGPGKKPPY